MARVKWFSYLLNKEGQPIQGADISIYLAASTTTATIYTSESGINTLSTAPQLTTNADGYFEFWVGDSTDLTNGYASTQKFKIAYEKSGIISGYNDYISVFAGFIAVDETDSDTTKDKTVSNNLAKGWEDHINDNDHIVHGIQEVDPTDSDPTKNKLVSNLLLYQTQGYSATIPSSAVSVSGSEYYYDISHALNDNYPIVCLFNNQEVFTPKDLQILNSNTVRVVLNSQIEFDVKVKV